MFFYVNRIIYKTCFHRGSNWNSLGVIQHFHSICKIKHLCEIILTDKPCDFFLSYKRNAM